MTDRKAVITGLGAVTPLDSGKGVNSFWDSLLRGENAIKPMRSLNTEGFHCEVGGEVNDFEKYLQDKSWLNFARCTRLFALSVQEALEDSDICLPETKTGVAFGTILGEINIGQKYFKEILLKNSTGETTLSKGYSPQSIPAAIADFFNFTGPNFTVNTACSSSGDAISLAANEIRRGRADIMIAGGAEQLSEMLFRGFSALGALTRDGRIRPFDADRTGTAIAEGAGAIILEAEEHAIARNARIYCELAGSGSNSEGYNLLRPRKDGEGLASAMKNALTNSSVDLDDIGYICAHGTGTMHNDSSEAKAIKDVFGETLDDVKVSSIKSMIGHLMGASAVIGAIAAIKSLETSKIPPTINFGSPDESCVFDCVPNRSSSKIMKAVMTLSAGFGGQNSALIFKKVNINDLS